jgi:hypothetical protein
MRKIENFKNTFQTSIPFFFLTIYTLSLIKYKPALLIASLIAIDPSRVAGTSAKELRNEPIGVLTALTITTSW